MKPTSPNPGVRSAFAVVTAFGLVAGAGVVAGPAAVAAPTQAPVTHVAPTPRPGAPGIGDPYYPLYGNGGYDVAHYGIKVDYDPASDLLRGTTTITAKATQNLKRFNLDLVLRASKVTVNGAAAKFRQEKGQELVVVPAKPIASGAKMTVQVTYAGVPSAAKPNGWSPWVRNPDGAVGLGEPEIAAWWFPSNDHPRDKATFNVSLTVPKGVEAISNGLLTSQKYGKKSDTWNWRVKKPMATYLAFVAIGQFDIEKGETKSGLPYLNAYAVNGGEAGARARKDIARTPEITEWLQRVYGPYPFEAIGGVAPAGKFGFALENQTRPVYSQKFWEKGERLSVVVHEMAHQWFGDSVSVQDWGDMWINEGFATYTEWLWDEQHGGPHAQKTFDKEYGARPADADFWRVILADPGPGNEFNGAVYDRGAMTVHALRNRIGDSAFFTLLRTWNKKHRYGNATVEDFQAMAEKISGEDLGSFFRVWLRTGSRPEATVENGFPAKG